MNEYLFLPRHDDLLVGLEVTLTIRSLEHVRPCSHIVAAEVNTYLECFSRKHNKLCA